MQPIQKSQQATALINLATHYSPSLDKYFAFDNGTFVWTGSEWEEYLESGFIEDLEECFIFYEG